MLQKRFIKTIPDEGLFFNNDFKVDDLLALFFFSKNLSKPNGCQFLDGEIEASWALAPAFFDVADGGFFRRCRSKLWSAAAVECADS
uniref:Uncharacterized protein n=1 Tax=Romanomermis culicivorax TaxID=13658 RepID=A0A915I9M6_ROMCU